MSAVTVSAPPAVEGPMPTQTVVPIDFVEAPLGLMGLRSFALHPLDDLGFLFAMRCTEAEDLRLFVVAPEPYFPGYAPTLPDTVPAQLGLTGDPTLLVVVHPGDDEHPPTANLLAPIVLNPVTGAALQVVLDSDQWALRARFTVAR
jgi:flagellar assembly factor FliW